MELCRCSVILHVMGETAQRMTARQQAALQRAAEGTAPAPAGTHALGLGMRPAILPLTPK